MVLNHYFTLVDKSFPEKKSLLEQGFIFSGPRKHSGQGTSAEFILFPTNYIEYIWIDNIEDSKNNLLKLHRRNEPKACKYGLCFSGSIPDNHKNDFIVYNPPYNPKNKILIQKESINNLSMPLIFCHADSQDTNKFEPQNNKNIQPELFNSSDNFFIPEELYKFSIPQYLKAII